MLNLIANALFRPVYSHVFKSRRSYNTPPRRALLYVPGDDMRKLCKSFDLDVDCIAMDCEDGDAINRKRQARCTIRDILDQGKPKRSRSYDLGVRINSVDTDWFKDDLQTFLTAETLPDTILLPKVESPDDLRFFAEEFNQYIRGVNKVDLIIYIESAMAFINLVDICKCLWKLSRTSQFIPAALVFGSDDFCASIGATRTEDNMEILYARQKLVLVAKAFNLQAIDMVYIKFQNTYGLKLQAEQGARMGYTGKQVIHPGQVSVVQEAFLPDPDLIQWAVGLLNAFEEHQKFGKGAFTYKGAMIDAPTMKQARNVMDLVCFIKNRS